MNTIRTFGAVFSMRNSFKLFQTRLASTLTVEDSRTKGIKILRMHNKPVNAMSLEFVHDLSGALMEIEADRTVKGLVLASNIPNIFMAGLDIREMYQQSDTHLREYWYRLQNLWLMLNRTRLAMAAAIEGNSPAGGCLVALTCDHRVIADGPFSIGLNETRLGIVAPSWFIDSFRAAVGQRNADRLLQLGTLLAPKQAVQVGLVDDIQPQGKVIDACLDELNNYISVPAAARHMSKLAIRKQIIEGLANNLEADIEYFIHFITRDDVQRGLGLYLKSLAKREK